MKITDRLTKVEIALKATNQEPTINYVIELGANLPIKEGNTLLVPAEVIELPK